MSNCEIQLQNWLLTEQESRGLEETSVEQRVGMAEQQRCHLHHSPAPSILPGDVKTFQDTLEAPAAAGSLKCWISPSYVQQ